MNAAYIVMTVPLPSVAPRKKRVTYVLPYPTTDPPALALPSIEQSSKRRLDPRPLLLPSSSALPTSTVNRSPEDQHPRHCLGISALALDLSTAVAPHDYSASSEKQINPAGILYSAGRDGLIASWELGLPTRKRKRAIGSTAAARRARALRYVDLGIDADLDSDYDSNGSSAGSSSDELPNTSASPRGARAGAHVNGHGSPIVGIPYEDRYEVDADALQQENAVRCFKPVSEVSG